MNDTVTLAFYGSLRKGGVWHSRWGLEKCKCLGTGRMPGALFILDGGLIPGMAPHETITTIVEVYEFPKKQLEGMDFFEHDYNRTPVSVTMEDGTAVAAEAYYYHEPFNRMEANGYDVFVEDGDYMNWVKENRPETIHA